jgi:alkylation response protein AidB-like acyl-CoA dehydrogenase
MPAPATVYSDVRPRLWKVGPSRSRRSSAEAAARYSDKRKAFGQKTRRCEAVGFMAEDALAGLDAARALTIAAGRVADADVDPRRLVSEVKKVATEAAWAAVNNAMQVTDGIGCTDVSPVERTLRDMRLTMIWTGTNDVMNLMVQHEYFRELREAGPTGRDVEPDANNPDGGSEKDYG